MMTHVVCIDYSMSSSAGSSSGEGGGLARWQIVVAAVGVSVAVAGTVGAVLWLCSKGGSKKASKPEDHSTVNSLTNSESGSTAHDDKELVSTSITMIIIIISRWEGLFFIN